MSTNVDYDQSNVLEALQSEMNTLEQYQLKDTIVNSIYIRAEDIANSVVTKDTSKRVDWDRKIDDILTSKYTGFPIMFLLLGFIFWLTIAGSNIPSQMLSNFFFGIEAHLTNWFMASDSLKWLHGVLVLGVYRTLAWVISVMLPPMAIFFPCFTLLEDLGYLPRVAFNLDRLFKKAGTHGKQSLTMSMGFGCNAAGVIACRIIESPRERLIAMLTNNFIPCNGRFPTLIALSTILVGGLVASQFSTLAASFFVSILVLFGIAITLLVSWLLANINVGDQSILNHSAAFLQPFADTIGLDGFILMAFILGLPANEIVFPILIMSYMSEGAMIELDSIQSMRELFFANGWTWLTTLNFMLFSLLHFPCGTTLWTIKKESGSMKWTLFGAVMPTAIAVIVLFVITQSTRFFGLV